MTSAVTKRKEKLQKRSANHPSLSVRHRRFHSTMFAVVPTCSSFPFGHLPKGLVYEAGAISEAIRPYLKSETGDCRIVKTAWCKEFYTALLCSDGRLLLLAKPRFLVTRCSISIAPSSVVTWAGHVTVEVLESGGEAVVDMDAGSTHITYCTVSGTVYSCGYSNAYGQLGDGTVWSCDTSSPLMPPMSTPKRVGHFGPLLPRQRPPAEAEGEQVPVATPPPPLDTHICEVACGSYHTLLLNRSHRCVYACGRGQRGQLGGVHATLLQPSFRAIPLLVGQPVAQIAAAGEHSVVVLETGKLLAFGGNISGQLGFGHTKCVLTPTIVPIYADAASLFAAAEETGTMEAAADVGALAAREKRPHLLDDKTFKTLRAPYASVEGTHYPLRTQRIDAELTDAPTTNSIHGSVTNEKARHRERIVQVRCGLTYTLAQTADGAWLSCGLPLTRGYQLPTDVSKVERLDGCGVLGRRLTEKTDAYYFQPVLWSAETITVLEDRLDIQPHKNANAEGSGTFPSSSAGCAEIGRTEILLNHNVAPITGGLSRVPSASFRKRSTDSDGNNSDGNSAVAASRMSLMENREKKRDAAAESQASVPAPLPAAAVHTGRQSSCFCYPATLAVLAEQENGRGAATAVFDPIQTVLLQGSGSQTAVEVVGQLGVSNQPIAVTMPYAVRLVRSTPAVNREVLSDEGENDEENASDAGLLRFVNTYHSFIPLSQFILLM